MALDLSVLDYVLIFVGIPAAVIVILMLAILAPGWTRAGRYRPGEPWNYEPILINAAISGPVNQAETETVVGEIGDGSDAAPAGEGGASARW